MKLIQTVAIQAEQLGF